MKRYSGLRPDRGELLRYLGYRGQPIEPPFEEMIKRCEDTAVECMTPREICQVFPIVFLKNGVEVSGTSLILTGNDIRRHLEGCDRCVLLAATIGSDIERILTLYAKTRLTEAMVLDAAATSLIETLCDAAEERFRAENGVRRCIMTTRFSPGYGDLPITLQPVLLEILQTQKRIGLTCSVDTILMPRKSVTAVIGISRHTVLRAQSGCGACNQRENCPYRKGD